METNLEDQYIPFPELEPLELEKPINLPTKKEFLLTMVKYSRGLE